MKLFLEILDKHVKAHEHSVRMKAKKKYDHIYQVMIKNARAHYEKWLHTKFYNYFPHLTYIDVDQATELAEREIPDFEFLVRMIAASYYITHFGQWVLQSKVKANPATGMADFEFEDGNN